MKEIILPYYARITLILLGITITGFLINIGQGIIMPLAFSLLLSILLLPFCKFLERLMPRWIAIIICIIAMIAVFLMVIYFISSQLASFADSAPQLKARLSIHIDEIQSWMQGKFGISSEKQSIWFSQKLDELYAQSGTYVTGTLNAVTNLFIFLGLIPVYVILFLYYRDHLRIFLTHIFIKGETKKVNEILHETRMVVQSYISGLLIEGVIVAVLNCAGLLMIGLPYAILIGIIASILNVIPYIGGLIAVLLATAIAILTQDSMFYPLAVIAVLLFIQFLDNHVLIPNIVASKVSLNALVSIVVVLIGGALCGVWGMFLSIPVTAILKIIFDNVEGLKPWGTMLGSGDEPDRLVSKRLKVKLK